MESRIMFLILVIIILYLLLTPNGKEILSKFTIFMSSNGQEQSN